MLGCEQRDEPYAPGGVQAVNSARPARIDPGVVGDQPDTLATNVRRNIGEELLDARENLCVYRGVQGGQRVQRVQGEAPCPPCTLRPPRTLLYTLSSGRLS
jgi:hypothetical protein